jgi:hypothetical protein
MLASAGVPAWQALRIRKIMMDVRDAGVLAAPHSLSCKVDAKSLECLPLAYSLPPPPSPHTLHAPLQPFAPEEFEPTLILETLQTYGVLGGVVQAAAIALLPYPTVNSRTLVKLLRNLGIPAVTILRVRALVTKVGAHVPRGPLCPVLKAHLNLNVL